MGGWRDVLQLRLIDLKMYEDVLMCCEMVNWVWRYRRSWIWCVL